MTNPDHEQRQDAQPGQIVLNDPAHVDQSPRDFEVEGIDDLLVGSPVSEDDPE